MTRATLKSMRNIFILSCALALGCDVPIDPDMSTSTGSTSSSDTGEPSTGEGYVCEDVGMPCDLDAPACAAGLACIERPEAPTGVCAQACETAADCAPTAGCIGGMCRDNDGLPTGLCEGSPSCAGDPCETVCANGLSCIVGACAFACETAKDCAEGQACLAGACFDNGGLADPCN